MDIKGMTRTSTLMIKKESICIYRFVKSKGMGNMFWKIVTVFFSDLPFSDINTIVAVNGASLISYIFVPFFSSL